MSSIFCGSKPGCLQPGADSEILVFENWRTAELGLEPRYSPPEGDVLPLDDSATFTFYHLRTSFQIQSWNTFLYLSLFVYPYRPHNKQSQKAGGPLDDPATLKLYKKSGPDGKSGPCRQKDYHDLLECSGNLNGRIVSDLLEKWCCFLFWPLLWLSTDNVVLLPREVCIQGLPDVAENNLVVLFTFLLGFGFVLFCLRIHESI